MTVMLFAGLTFGAVAVDSATRELLADVRLAMKRADLSIDYVARACGVPPAKLSHQLSGDLPFTYCWRILANAEIHQGSEFWPELLAIRAERINRALVSADLGALIVKVEELVGYRRMLKAALPARYREETKAS